jgi:2-oxoglutarate dehydrogenase E2 component (dihydrolipoamide succinyltransferase)
MAVDITIPTIGESISEVTVGLWLKADGAWVDKDEPVLELETDKVNQELAAPDSGILRITAKPGETLPIGGVAGRIEPGEKPAGAAPATKEAAAPAAKPAEKAPAPAAKAEKAPAPASVKPAPAAEPAKSAAKAPEPQKPAPAAAPATVPAPMAPATLPAPVAPAALPVTDRRPVHQIASPMAIRLAAEYNVDLYRVPGSGYGGRVTSDDVRAWVATHGPGTVAPAAPAPPRGRPAGDSAPATVSTPGPRGVRRERMSQLRKRIAQRLVEAQHTAAMLTTFNEVDMTEVMEIRNRYKDGFKDKHGVGLGFMSFFVAAAVEALKAFPRVNAYIENDDVVYHDYIDIGVAVGTERGLVVPVLRNCEKLSFADIEKAIRDYAVKARDGKLSIDDLSGGTFTISNGGVYGSLMSTPILNPPQSGILGMHNIVRRPVAVGDQIVIRPMMYIALSYDHRIVDGKEAVGFLVRIKECIERPERLLLNV